MTIMEVSIGCHCVPHHQYNEYEEEEHLASEDVSSEVLIGHSET